MPGSVQAWPTSLRPLLESYLIPARRAPPFLTVPPSGLGCPRRRYLEEDTMTSRRKFLALSFSFVVSGFVAPQAQARDAVCRTDWVATWGAAMQAPLFAAPPTFTNVTLREIVHISLGAEAMRVRFSNAIGTTPFTINAASVGVRAQGADVVAGTLRRLTFSGTASI